MSAGRAGIVALAATLVAGVACAACPLEQLLIEGVVVSATDGTPVAGAVVEAGWDERAAGRMSISRESGTDGAFALRVAFDTYSGRTLAGRDVCDARLSRLDLRIEHPRHQAHAQVLAREAIGAPLRIELAPSP